jgi:hypothetical protein
LAAQVRWPARLGDPAEVSIILPQRDGLARLDLELIEWLAGKRVCEIVVTNQQSLPP